MSDHKHVFDSERHITRFYSCTNPKTYSGAVSLGCACGMTRIFTPVDGQPTSEFWGVDMGKPNPPLPSQPAHLAWDASS